MSKTVYYILFENYQDGLKLRDELLKENIDNRIAPAPYALLGEVSCGMALLIMPEEVERAKNFLKKTKAKYHSIVPLENQLQSKRDKYC